MSGKALYDAKDPAAWLQMLRDYVAGRSSEMDVILDWVESRTEEITESDMITSDAGGSAPMIDVAGQGSLKEVARQLWAMLSPLLVNNGTVTGMFANVPRHNGLEAWRRIYEQFMKTIFGFVKICYH